MSFLHFTHTTTTADFYETYNKVQYEIAIELIFF